MNHSPAAIPGLRLHHVGVVVSEIEAKRSAYGLLGYSERTGIIHDLVQTAYVQFLQLPDSESYLELVAPDGPDSKLTKAASRRHPLNHLCYVVDNIHQACRMFVEQEWVLISEPTAAVAFEGRPIAWVSSPDLLIIELVERGPAGSL